MNDEGAEGDTFIEQSRVWSSVLQRPVLETSVKKLVEVRCLQYLWVLRLGGWVAEYLRSLRMA